MCLHGRVDLALLCAAASNMRIGRQSLGSLDKASMSVPMSTQGREWSGPTRLLQLP